MRNFSRILVVLLVMLWLSPSPALAAPGCRKMEYRIDSTIAYTSKNCNATVKPFKKKKIRARQRVKKIGKKSRKGRRSSRNRPVKGGRKKKKGAVPAKKKTVLAREKKSVPARKPPAVLAEVRLMQALLVRAGYPLKDIDGLMGRKTRGAMTRYAKKHGIMQNEGGIMPAVLEHLKRGDAGTAVAGSRPGVTAPEKAVFPPGFRREDVRALQEGLVRAGYRLDHVDGRMEKTTRQAMRTYYLKQQVRRSNATVFSAVLAHIRARPATAVVRPVAYGGAIPGPVTYTPSAERGKKFAEECRGCHSFGKGEGNMSGPNLFGVMDQLIGSERRFRYSDTLRAQMDQGKVWSRKELHCYLEDPEACKPGTNMGFGGIKSHKKRADIIAYLARLKY